MKRIYMGIGITVVLCLLLAGAFAFSLTLQNLRVSAYSFAQPAEAAGIAAGSAAPMTGADESAISSPDSGQVRMEEFAQPEHLCQKDRVQNRATDF